MLNKKITIFFLIVECQVTFLSHLPFSIFSKMSARSTYFQSRSETHLKKQTNKGTRLSGILRCRCRLKTRCATLGPPRSPARPRHHMSAGSSAPVWAAGLGRALRSRVLGGRSGGRWLVQAARPRGSFTARPWAAPLSPSAPSRPANPAFQFSSFHPFSSFLQRSLFSSNFLRKSGWRSPVSSPSFSQFFIFLRFFNFELMWHCFLASDACPAHGQSFARTPVFRSSGFSDLPFLPALLKFPHRDPSCGRVCCLSLIFNLAKFCEKLIWDFYHNHIKFID